MGRNAPFIYLKASPIGYSIARYVYRLSTIAYSQLQQTETIATDQGLFQCEKCLWIYKNIQ
jgi:hypothetical protein